MLRSHRLEQLLGAPVAELTAAHLRAAVETRVVEGYDLDWKRDSYGKTDSEKRELAADVAALANTAGGLIVLGVAEDDHACAVAAPGVPLDDDERNRIIQVVASLVAPVPDFDVRMIPDEAGRADSNHGFVAISVERSAAAPHAVAVQTNLRYPRRAGTTTRYLSEPEVADAYRQRLAGLANVEERLSQVWADGISRLDVSSRPYGCVALVPDAPGSMTINRDVFEAFRTKWVARNPNVLVSGMQTWRATVGHGRLSADGARQQSSPTADWLAIDLYTDGAGFYAAHVGNPLPSNGSADALIEHEQLVEDEFVANAVLTGLLELAAHAESVTAAGTALVLAGIHGIAPTRPTYLGNARQGFSEPYSRIPLTQPHQPVAGALPLDLLAAGGRPLVALGSRLCDQIGQAFGIPEMNQLSSDGMIRSRYTSLLQYPGVRDRAVNAGFEISDEA